MKPIKHWGGREVLCLLFVLLSMLSFVSLCFGSTLMIPGEGAVVMPTGKKGFPVQPVLFLRWMDYQYNPGGVALWPNHIGNVATPSVEGYGICQVEEVKKPTTDGNAVYIPNGTGLAFTNVNTALNTINPWTIMIRTTRPVANGRWFWILNADVTFFGSTLGIAPISSFYSSDINFLRDGDYVYTMCVNTASKVLTFYRNGLQHGNTVAFVGSTYAGTGYLFNYNAGNSAIGSHVKYMAAWPAVLSSSQALQASRYILSLP